MIVDKCADIPHLVRDHLKTMAIIIEIWKILYASIGKLLLTSVLIVLKNICQKISCFYCSGVEFHNSGK